MIVINKLKGKESPVWLSFREDYPSRMTETKAQSNHGGIFSYARKHERMKEFDASVVAN